VTEATRQYSLDQGYNLHWYEIQSVLGRGGNGMTYLAHDKNLDRLVAIKEYLPINCASHDHSGAVQPLNQSCNNVYNMGLSRFLTEARTLAKFVHPNIVRVHSVFEENNTAYMVMEYEQGQGLAEIYESQENLSEQALLDIFVPILDGLLLVHQAGFVHRDIKPANIYVRQDHSPVLLDFGSAKQTSHDITRTLTILATYGYTPFEQYGRWNMEQGPWTDIYSLGASIYSGITGEKPIDSLKRAGAIIGSKTDLFVPLSAQALPGYSKHFLLAVDNALMFHPNDRPQHISQWVDMLLGKVMPPALPDNLIKLSEDKLADIEAAANISNDKQDSKDIVKRQSEPDRISPADLAPGAKDQQYQSYSPSSNISQHSGNTGETSPDTATHRLPDFAKNWPLFVSEWTIRQRIFSAALLLFAVGLIVFFLPQETGITQPEEPKLNPHHAAASNKEQSPAEDRYKALLEKAHNAYAAKHYITPETDNAAALYLKVLAMDPENKAAKEGLEAVVSHVSGQIQSSIEAGDLLGAENQLNKIDGVVVKSGAFLQPQLSLEKAKRSKAESINQLLNKGQIAFDSGHVIHPEKDSAIEIFQQVLNIDPLNETAQRDLRQIHDQFLSKAKHYVAAGNMEKARTAVAVMEAAMPDSSQAQMIEANIQSLENKNRQIARLQQQAEADLKSGRKVKPAGDNALHRYQQILKLDKNNQKATQGINDLLADYQSQFYSNTEDNNLSDAQKAVEAIALIAPDSPLSEKLATELASLRQPSKPELEVINELIHDFRNSFETNNMAKLQHLSEFAPGRQQFLEQFFAQYRFFKLQIKDFEYITVQHQASAIVSLDDLVSKEGEHVKPGPWNQFLIQIAKNQQGKWKVHW
jgi:serine/threonine protein kinase